MLKSTDGGDTWSALNRGLPVAAAGYPDILALAVDPTTPGRLYAGTAGTGVFVIEQGSACVGDCGGDRQVTVDDVLTMVRIGLGAATMSECPVGDGNDDGQITVDEIVTAVRNALSGCD